METKRSNLFPTHVLDFAYAWSKRRSSLVLGWSITVGSSVAFGVVFTFENCNVKDPKLSKKA